MEYKDGQANYSKIKHRKWFKVLFNPILRRFGYCIVSVFDNTKNKVTGYEIRKYPTNCKVIKK